jgi:hypothetical protein
MSNASRIWTVSLGLAGMIAASGAFLGTADTGTAIRVEPAPVLVETYTAVVESDWLPPDEARLQLETRSVALEAVVRGRGHETHVVETRQRLRTRSQNGARLAQPLARFERTLAIGAGNARDDIPEELRALNVAFAGPRGGG